MTTSNTSPMTSSGGPTAAHHHGPESHQHGPVQQSAQQRGPRSQAQGMTGPNHQHGGMAGPHHHGAETHRHNGLPQNLSFTNETHWLGGHRSYAGIGVYTFNTPNNAPNQGGPSQGPGGQRGR